MKPSLSHAAQIALLAAVYVLVARLGLMLDAVGGFATLVWPPTGIALAALWCFGLRLWPGVAIGALVANLSLGAPLLVGLGIAAGNTLEAALGAYALRRFAFMPALDRLRDVLVLVIFAAFLSTAVSATVGVFSLYAGGLVPGDRLALTWRAWWLGDLIGALVIAPLLLTWSGVRRLPRIRLEALALLLCLLSLHAFVFSPRPTPELPGLRQLYIIFPVLIWAAVRFGQRGVTAVMFLAGALAVAGTVMGVGPFVQAPLHQALMSLQVFIAIAAITSLVLGAAVSERVAAEQEASASRNLLRAVVEGSVEPIYLKDVAGRYLLVNEATARALGHPADAIAGKDDGAILPEAEARAIMEEDRRIMESGGWRSVEEVLTVAGVTRVYLSTKAPFRDARGEIAGIIGVSRDITERKEMDEEIRRQAGENARLYRQAEEAVRARDEFLSIASHELRTPLSALVLQLGAIQRALKDSGLQTIEGKLEKRIAVASRATDRLVHLVDDLLDVSRAATGSLDLLHELCDLSEIALEVVEQAAETARKADCAIELRQEGNACGMWDRARLEQVLTNLLSNALKYGAGRPVAIEVEGDEGLVRVLVRDGGPGIRLEDRERIFGRFERAASPRNFGGLGLGLYITRQIVEAHGGTIRVVSEPGAGASFLFELPSNWASRAIGPLGRARAAREVVSEGG